ncbi:MAG: hypothetical protein AB1806_04660 [Acidobacteriota bacterium]
MRAFAAVTLQILPSAFDADAADSAVGAEAPEVVVPPDPHSRWADGRLSPAGAADGCYHAVVTRADILAFARRDWSCLEEAKAQYWLEYKAGLTPTDALAFSDQLRRHARQLRPDWPDEGVRIDDLLGHARVAEALRAVPSRPR